MTEGWICGRCGSSNSPLLLVCGCSKPTSTATSTAPQVTANGTSTVAFEQEVENFNKNHPPKRRRFIYQDEQFELFWISYPRRVGKAAAFRRWKEVVASGVAPQTVIEAAKRYAVEVKDKEPQYIKYPEGWLNAGRWDDEAPVVKIDARYQPYDHEAHMRELEDIG